MGTRCQHMQAEVAEGVGAQVAQVVAGRVLEGFARDQPAAGGQRPRGAAEQFAAGGGGEFVQDVVQQDQVVFLLRRHEFRERGAMRAQDGFRPAGLAQRGKELMQAAQGGPGMVPRGEHGRAGPEVVEQRPGGGAGAGAEIEDAQRPGRGRERRQFGQDVGQARVGLGGEVERIGQAGAGVAQIRRAGCGGVRPGRGEAVGEPGDVGEQAVDHVAGGFRAGFGPGHLQPLRFEFGGIFDQAHAGAPGGGRKCW